MARTPLDPRRERAPRRPRDPPPRARRPRLGIPRSPPRPRVPCSRRPPPAGALARGIVRAARPKRPASPPFWPRRPPRSRGGAGSSQSPRPADARPRRHSPATARPAFPKAGHAPGGLPAPASPRSARDGARLVHRARCVSGAAIPGRPPASSASTGPARRGGAPPFFARGETGAPPFPGAPRRFARGASAAEPRPSALPCPGYATESPNLHSPPPPPNGTPQVAMRANRASGKLRINFQPAYEVTYPSVTGVKAPSLI